jgi:hypothetical protein
MADTPTKELPTTVPMPNFDLIRAGGMAGQEELATTLRNLIIAFNQYVARKGA